MEEKLDDEADLEDDYKGNKKSEEFITIRKDNLWKYSTFILLAVVLLMGFLYFSSGKTTTGKVIANQPSIQQPGPTARVEVSADDDPFKGDENAPVTIIEFSDYECPFCGRFYSQTLGQIDDQYIKKGKIKFVYRDFPLSFHTNAQKAAEAANCAGEQGKYFEMHDLLFEKGVSGGVSGFKEYAKELGLDSGKFNSCLDSGKTAKEVEKDFEDGQNYGVQGTPAFFINGKLLSGAQPISAFQQAIDEELK